MKRYTKEGKFLSYLLRHSPESIGLKLNEKGWGNIDDIIQASKKSEYPTITFEELLEIVETNSKKRFEINESKTKIRAVQGHSIKINLDLKSQRPPDVLYHGTNKSTSLIINNSGIKKMKRHAVHLSPEIYSAIEVAKRRKNKEHILLEIDSKKMFKDGYKFYKSLNNVWLTEFVPKMYIHTNRR